MRSLHVVDVVDLVVEAREITTVNIFVLVSVTVLGKFTLMGY